MDVRLPNGVVMQNVPEGTSKDVIRAKAIRNGLATAADFGETSDLAAQIPTEGYNQEAAAKVERTPAPSRLDYALQGAAAVPIMAGGARVLQAFTRGSKAAPYATRAAEALIPKTGKQLVYEGALGGAAGLAGGVAGEQVPEGWKRDAVTLAAGAAVSAPFAMGKNAFDLWVSRGVGSEALQSAGQVSGALGQARASSQAQTAIRANPNLVPTVLRASEIEQKTGISLPMLAAANGDTTISSFLQSQLAKGENAEFAASMKAQYEAAEAALTKAKKGVAPSMQEVDAYVKRKATEAQTINQQVAEKAKQTSQKRQVGLEAIDNRIRELTETISAPGRQETGQALTNLLGAKEKAIRGELSPKYEELINNSVKAGIVLPGQSAKALKNFAQDTINDDVFAKFPSLYGMIKREFRTPSPIEGSKTATKYKFAKEAAQPKDVSLKTLDSLKREVNKALRDTTDNDQIRKLVLLKKEVDAAIDTVDPAFSAPYRAIDREYAERLGIPFSEQGVVNINKAKFISDTVPQMTKNADALKQTLAVIGDTPEGLKVVEDAFMFDLSNNRGVINTATGKLNTAQLRRYLAQNKEKIDLVPGLRQKLDGLGDRVDVLSQNRTALLEAEKQASQEKIENLWTQAYGTKDGIRGVVRSALNNPQQLDQLLSVAGKDKVAQAGLKSALLEDVLNAPGDRIELLKQNKQAFEKIFGKKETENLGLIVEASQRLKDNPFALRININTISKTAYEELTGSRLETTLGEARNQVLSMPRVFINHLSRYFQKQTNASETAEIQKFLLDPKNLELTARMVQELETKGMTDKVMGMTKQMLKNSSSAYLFGALTGLGVGSQAPQPTEYTPSDSSLLEGFGQ